MEEVKTPNADKKSMWMTLISFGVYVLFFLFFCIGLVSLGKESFGAGEIIDYIKDPKLLLSDMLFDSIKALFDKNGDFNTTVLMKAVFVIWAMVVFVIFVVKAIFAVLSLVRAASGSVEWDKAEETMSKKLKSCVHTLVGFIVAAYLMMGKGFVELEAGAWIFIIVGTLYIVGKDAFNDKDLIKTNVLKYVLELVYDVAKIALAILALSYLLTWPLISMFVSQLKNILMSFAHKTPTGDIVKELVLPLVCFILVYIAVGRGQKVLENNIKGDEAKAKSSSVKALIFAVIAAVALAIVMAGVNKMEFKDWWEFYGKDFLKMIIFAAIAYAVYYAPMLIDMVCGKSAAPAAVEAEVAATEESAEEDK